MRFPLTRGLGGFRDDFLKLLRLAQDKPFAAYAALREISLTFLRHADLLTGVSLIINLLFFLSRKDAEPQRNPPGPLSRGSRPN